MPSAGEIAREAERDYRDWLDLEDPELPDPDFPTPTQGDDSK